MSTTQRNMSGLAILAAAALLSACAGPSGNIAASGANASGAQAQARYADITPDSVRIFVNRVNQPFELVKSVRSEVYVSDADSEQAAELQAFRAMLQQAREAGANSVMEVRRSITRDGVAVPAIGSGQVGSSTLFRDDLDPNATPLDDITLADYWRGKGTLSAARIDRTFQQRNLSQKAVVFTAKAIRVK